MSKVLADPPSEQWTRVSPKLTSVEQITDMIAGITAVAVASVPLVLHLTGVWSGYPAWLAWLVPGLVLLSVAVGMIVTPFQVRSRRYALRQDDIAVARGVIYHRMEVIPYGRIQYVDVVAGPLMRAFGLCKLQIHTASPDAHPEIAGLLAADGAALRDQLSQRGEERLAGL